MTHKISSPHLSLTTTIKRYSLAFFLLFTSNFAFAVGDDDFITTWRTTGINEEITLPISGTNFNVTVDWGDGSTAQTTTSANPTHTYATVGTQTVTVSGIFDRINLSHTISDEANDAKLIAVIQWGTTHWSSMGSAFSNANNLVIPTTLI